MTTYRYGLFGGAMFGVAFGCTLAVGILMAGWGESRLGARFWGEMAVFGWAFWWMEADKEAVRGE